MWASATFQMEPFLSLWLVTFWCFVFQTQATPAETLTKNQPTSTAASPDSHGDDVSTGPAKLIPLEAVFSSEDEADSLLFRPDDHSYASEKHLSGDQHAANVVPSDMVPTKPSNSNNIIPSTADVQVDIAAISETDAMAGVAAQVSIPSTSVPADTSPSDLMQMQHGIRRRWDPEDARQLGEVMAPYYTELLKSNLLPKVNEVSRILLRHGLRSIIEKNGRVRTMEKVRQEYKLFKKGGKAGDE